MAPDHRSDLLEPRRRSSALPLIGESVTPWLGAAFALAALNVAMLASGYELGALEQSLVLIGLCASLAAAGLVAARSNGALQVLIRAERARPATEELVGLVAEARAATYLTGMDGWTTAMLELIEHAASVVEPDSAVHAELVAARVETRDLRDLLRAESAGPLTINDQAKLHALGSLWETSQRRVEHLAAEVDPSWHRRWRARAVVARKLRHGHDLPSVMVLPYCT